VSSAASALRTRVRPKRLARLLAVGAAIVAALTQATSLVDWVDGKLHHAATGPIAPQILSIERQSPLSLRDYLRGVNERPPATTTAGQLDAKGLVYALTMRIRGEQGSRFGLRWFVVDGHGNRLRGPSFNQEPAIFAPRRQDQLRTYPVWIPTPSRPGKYEVTFALVNAKGEPVAQKLGPPFRIAA
jgi:hypothetical protein